MAVVLSSFLRLTSSLSPLPTQTARTLSPPRQRRAAPQLCLHHQTCLPPLLHMFMHQRLPRQTLRHRHLKRQDVDDRDTPGNNNANIPMHWHRLHSPSHTRTITITRHSSSSSSSKRQLSGTSTRSRSLSPLYINLRQFSFQLPLWQDMRREGLPIEGFCVVAGIPTTEKADEIIDGLKSVGIRHVAFKPGSIDGICQVVNIAAAHPDFAIILQWTSGRVGGRHSFEDFHQNILATYSSIRRHKNIALVAGSDDTWPYLCGDWSAEFGVEPMPFDGFLFASRVMVAKEARTSPSVKDLIVAASGVDDSQWESTYVKDTGGIITVRSELGEPIHKVSNRALKLWKEYDDTVFKLAREKRGAWLQERPAEVIKRLNADYFKPWFPAKKDGRIVEDLGDMTYEETVLRLVRLMYVAHEDRWLDLSLRNLTGDWLRRVEERFAGVNGGGPKASVLQSYSSLDQPAAFVSTFFEKYPVAKEQLLAHEDKSYFLNITQRSGQKLAPFIPILDNSFEVWFKKVSSYV